MNRLQPMQDTVKQFYILLRKYAVALEHSVENMVAEVTLHNNIEMSKNCQKITNNCPKLPKIAQNWSKWKGYLNKYIFPYCVKVGEEGVFLEQVWQPYAALQVYGYSLTPCVSSMKPSPMSRFRKKHVKLMTADTYFKFLAKLKNMSKLNILVFERKKSR